MRWKASPAENRYRCSVDVKRAADLYAQGRTLRQIGAELGVSRTTVSQQLRQAGVTMRRGGPPAHATSTQKILELRDQDVSWTEVAEQVDMTRSGAWSRYRKALPSKSPRSGRWQQVLTDAIDKNLAIGVRAAVADHLGRTRPGPNLLLLDEPPMVSLDLAVPVCFTCRGRMRTAMQGIATTSSWQSQT